jgi:hypothetical protein
MLVVERSLPVISGFEVTCGNKDPRGIIIRIGGEGWSLPVQEAIMKILSEQLRLNIRVEGKLVDVGVRGEGPDAYLALEPDGDPLHDLTDLLLLVRIYPAAAPVGWRFNPLIPDPTPLNSEKGRAVR